jgi:cytochrome subunit of sulfide dehydrogenase
VLLKYLPIGMLLCSSWSIAADEHGGHLRVLAASCAACHGADGNSIGGTPVLAGLDRTQFITQMQAFRNGALASTVMHHHAKGLTPQEIEQLADYFSAQPRKAASSPMPLGALM